MYVNCADGGNAILLVVGSPCSEASARLRQLAIFPEGVSSKEGALEKTEEGVLEGSERAC